MDSNLVDISSLKLLDDILLELECPVTFELMNSAATFSCMHNFHEKLAIDLCGLDGNNPKVGANCPLCRKPITYWKKNYAIEGLVPKIEKLQKQIMSEQVEINRLKKAEEYLDAEITKMVTMQKLHKEMFIPKFSQEINVNMEKNEIEIGVSLGVTVGLSTFSSIMQCFSNPMQQEQERWNT